MIHKLITSIQISVIALSSLLALTAQAKEETMLITDFSIPGEWTQSRWNKADGRIALRPNVPPALKDTEDAPEQSLGVKIEWPGGEGFRFFNVEPANSEPIPFEVKELRLWYSGTGTGHLLVVVVDDAQGKSHKLPIGKMESTQWEQARLRVPAKVAQPITIKAINQHDWGIPTPAETTAYFSRLEAVVDTEKPLGAGSASGGAGKRNDDW